MPLEITNTPKLLSLLLAAAGILYAVLFLASASPRKKPNHLQPQPNHIIIPFIFTQPNSPIATTKAVYASLGKYRTEISQALFGLSQSLEKALALEQEKSTSRLSKSARMSTKIQERIQKISKCLEEDELVLQRLLLTTLTSSDILAALPDDNSLKNSNISIDKGSAHTLESLNYPPTQPPSTIFQISTHSKKLKPLDEINVYDSAAQIVAHLVRDWTGVGVLIRRNLYDWCRMQLHNYYPNPDTPVLVPGAGMGRLAFELYKHGHIVEANELSPVMAAAAFGILQRNFTAALHPFVMDIMSNEVESSRRYDAIEFPDTLIGAQNIEIEGGRLSFTIGDFCSDYYLSQKKVFGAIVTCFFIDTASNIYEYIELIRQLLKKGGVWVNVGPVQWHRNALLRPSVDELKDLITAYGFDILHWTVDKEAVPYRQDDDCYGSGVQTKPMSSFVRTTNFDAYRPLRFVAIRK